MNKKAIVPVILLTVAIAVAVIWLFSKRQVGSNAAAPPTAVVPTATVAAKIVVPAPAREVPASVVQSMQKALADRQEKLQHLGETPSSAEKK